MAKQRSGTIPREFLGQTEAVEIWGASRNAVQTDLEDLVFDWQEDPGSAARHAISIGTAPLTRRGLSLDYVGGPSR